MAEKNTSLINELLLKVAQHPEFETWRQKSKHPTGIAKELCQLLKTDPRYSGQPSRFYASAIALVNYTYKSNGTKKSGNAYRLSYLQLFT